MEADQYTLQIQSPEIDPYDCTKLQFAVLIGFLQSPIRKDMLIKVMLTF
jgi:hypothetical protein